MKADRKSNRMLLSFIVMGLLSTLGACSRVATQETQSGHSERATAYTALTSTGAPIDVRLVSRTFEKTMPYKRTEFWGEEVEDTPETWIVSNLEVKINGKSTLVPLSAYSNLANVNELRIVVGERGFNLEIDGGQTGGHYKSTLAFDAAGKLLRRKTFSASFPDEAWEELTYSFIPDDGR